MVKIAEEIVHNYASGLFSRLLAVASRSETIEPSFEYELTQEPTSMFKDHMMRKSNKAKLKQNLTRDAHNLESISEGKIVDGDALLHQVKMEQEFSIQHHHEPISPISGI